MRRSAILVTLLALVAGLAPSPPAGTVAGPSLDAYRGLGSWVDLYDDAEWKDPASVISAMASYGVRTLYLETSNYRAKKDIVYPAGVAGYIQAAHTAGMRVVAWYLPSLANIPRDLRRSLAAIQAETSDGQRFDSFGLDIEASVVTDPNERSQRVLKLSSKIRAAVGPSYPLAAIVPSPRGMRHRPDYWPGFPFAGLTQYYDVFLPMSYFAYRTSGAQGAHDYIADNISIVRTKTGVRTIPIHIIGGIADDTSEAEARGMVRAARERGILGASLYDFATSGPEDWRAMAAVPVNPAQSPSMPVAAGSAAELGNIPGGDRTHPKEVFYKSGGATTANLRFQVFGVQPGEVSLWVNWHRVRDVLATHQGSWSGTRTVSLAASLLRSSGTNYVAFVARGDFPRWSVWGVRRVTLS